MIPIGVEIPAEQLPNLVFVRVLEQWEGELLGTLREPTTGAVWLRSWVSCDATAHRWLYWRVTPSSLVEYLDMRLTFLALIKSAVGAMYLRDVEDGAVHRTATVEFDELPGGYLPKPECLPGPILTDWPAE
jgi:hypothetical protein